MEESVVLSFQEFTSKVEWTLVYITGMTHVPHLQNPDTPISK